jgi:thiamine kinase-like enzyme
MRPQPLPQIATRLAQVQREVMNADLAGLPSYAVERIAPDLLADLSTSDDQPAGTVDWLADALPQLQSWAAELVRLCPPSLDHPDVNPSNALVGVQIVLIDWEEAVVGCPMMSLHRLLADAAEADRVDAVKAAYLAPWRDLPDAARALDLALRLAPLKLAAEARSYARGLGWDHPHARLTARLLSEARAAGAR